MAIALLAGLNGPKAGRLALFVVPAAWLLGGLAGFAVGAPLVPGTVTAASFLVLGGLTAADRRLPPTAVTALAAALGLLHGWLNGAGIAEAGREALGLVGIVSAVFVVVALLAAFVVWLRPPVDPDRRPGGRQLDRGDRAASPRLGPARRLLTVAARATSGSADAVPRSRASPRLRQRCP